MEQSLPRQDTTPHPAWVSKTLECAALYQFLLYRVPGGASGSLVRVVWFLDVRHQPKLPPSCIKAINAYRAAQSQ